MLTTLPPFCAVVMKSGYFNFLEPSGPLQACNGTYLFLKLRYKPMGQVGVGEGKQTNVTRDTFWSPDITWDLNQRGYEGLDLWLGGGYKNVYT
jgi:hypothetical protein